LTSLTELEGLPGLSLSEAAARLGLDPASREHARNYGSLTNVDSIRAKGSGFRLFARDNKVVLVYVSEAGLPHRANHQALARRAGTGVRTLRSRQGRTAQTYVAAEAGLAWSALGGDIGWIELFPPMSFDAYRETIYKEPPTFIR
jgi:hypothetical protein